MRGGRQFEAPNHVHLWTVPLEQPDEEVEQCARLLSYEERGVAAKFQFAEHRRRYVVAHAALRRILAGYLEQEPAEIQFTQAPGRKPRLLCGDSPCFNLSHSCELAMVAVSSTREVGVDIEQHRDLDDFELLARDVFAADEELRWRAHPGAARTSAFYNQWTMKEALLKAMGVGLAANLRQISVDAARPAWQGMQAVAPAGYSAAVCLSGPEAPVVQEYAL